MIWSRGHSLSNSFPSIASLRRQTYSQSNPFSPEYSCQCTPGRNRFSRTPLCDCTKSRPLRLCRTKHVECGKCEQLTFRQNPFFSNLFSRQSFSLQSFHLRNVDERNATHTRKKNARKSIDVYTRDTRHTHIYCMRRHTETKTKTERANTNEFSYFPLILTKATSPCCRRHCRRWRRRLRK